MNEIFICVKVWNHCHNKLFIRINNQHTNQKYIEEIGINENKNFGTHSGNMIVSLGYKNQNEDTMQVFMFDKQYSVETNDCSVVCDWKVRLVITKNTKSWTIPTSEFFAESILI